MKNIAEIHQLTPRPIATTWMCSACGIDAACNCGAALMSKSQRIADAVAAEPEKSSRKIADELGVSHTAVDNVRNSTGNNLPVENETRIGLDGKERRMPRRQEDEFDEELAYSQTKAAFVARAAEAQADAKFNGLIDQEIVQAADDTAAAWCQLVSELKGKMS